MHGARRGATRAAFAVFVASPPAAVVTRLAAETLLDEGDVRGIFKSMDAKRAKARRASAASQAESSSSDEDIGGEPGAGWSSAPPAKRAKPAGSRAPRPIAPLVSGKLKGRKVLIPASMWPDESCDEFEGEGCSAMLGTESRGVVGVKAVRYSCFYFQVEEVLKRRPLK